MLEKVSSGYWVLDDDAYTHAELVGGDDNIGDDGGVIKSLY